MIPLLSCDSMRKEVTAVKKRLLALLLTFVVILSSVAPVMAVQSITVEPVSAVEYEISPHTEMARVYWRTYHGNLQWRLWSITNARWMNDWTDANLL